MAPSSSLSLSSSYTIAKLPRPLETAQGRYHGAQVWGIGKDVKKRARAEVAIGIDGEGINIYNVEHSRLSTTYALPPHVSLTCPPCSVRQHVASGPGIQRVTYASTVTPDPQLFGFAETNRKASEAQPRLASSDSTFTRTLERDHGDVVFLDTLARTDDNANGLISDVLLVHRDGDLRCFSGDLETERWRCAKDKIFSTQGDHVAAPALQVEFAALIDPDAGRGGLLQGRDDALAYLDALATPETNSNEQIALLVLLTRPADDAGSDSAEVVLHVVVILPKPSIPPIQHAPVRPLCQFRLPVSGTRLARIRNASLDAQSGALQYISEGALISFDLAGTSPRLLSRLEGTEGGFVSFLRLSQAHTLTATRTCLAIYDVYYQAATFVLPAHSSTIPVYGKRKHSFSFDAPSHPATDLLAFLPSLGLTIGRVDGELVGFSIVTTGDARPGSKRAKYGVLLDALGHGLPSSSDELGTRQPALTLPPLLGACFVSPDKPDYRHLEKRLTRIAMRKNLESFERECADIAGISRNEEVLLEWRKQKNLWVRDHKPGGDSRNGTSLPNGLPKAADEHHTFPLPKPLPPWNDLHGTLSVKAADDEKVRIVLRAIFAYGRHDSDSQVEGEVNGALKMTLGPPNAFRWLVRSGNMTLAKLQNALGEAALGSLPPPITTHMLMEAVINFDPELVPLLFDGPVFLEAGDVAQALRSLISHLQRQQPPQHQVLPDATNGEKADPWASLQRALASALTRLHTFPPPLISQAFRSSLTQDELVFVIQTLRRSLSLGGWTAWLLDDDVMLGDDIFGDGADVSLIGDLLGCAFDSIGAAGWLRAPSGGTADLTTADFLTSLRLELSAALEVVEEATFIKGLIDEMLHYGKSAGAASKPSVTARHGQPNKTNAGIIVVEPKQAGSNHLPLGARAEPDISLSKVGAGGEMQRRSDRDMARLRNMQVGKYTLERIVI